MNIRATIAAFALAIALWTLSFAGESPAVIEMIDRLEESLVDCKWSTRNLKGAPLGRMLLHKKTMEDVLEALRAGAVVDRQLEQALKAHPST